MAWSACRAWGIVGHLHFGPDVRPGARLTTHNCPEVSRFYAELWPEPRPLARYKAPRDSPEYALSAAPTHPDNDPRLPPLRRRTAGRKEAAPQSHPGGELAHRRQIRKPARRNQRLRRPVTDEAELAGLPADAIQAARGSRKRRQRAGNSPCTCRPTCLRNSSPTAAACAVLLLRNTATRLPNSAWRTFRQHPLIRRSELRKEAEPCCRLRQLRRRIAGSCMAESVPIGPGFSHDPARAKPFAEKDGVARSATNTLGLATLNPGLRLRLGTQSLPARYTIFRSRRSSYFTEPNLLAGSSMLPNACTTCASLPTRRPSWQ